MGLFDWLKKKNTAGTAEQPEETESLELYTGLQVEVASPDGQLLFVAKLLGVRGGKAELHQRSGGDIEPAAEPAQVIIRGYSGKDKKAVYFEGVISPERERVWRVEGLTLTKLSNERTFFRLDTNIDAQLTPIGKTRGKPGPCTMLNISVGGACFSTDAQYEIGNQMQLTVKLHPEWEPLVVFCQVVRIVTRGEGIYEYGCQFVDLKEADEEKLTQIIFDLQRRRNY